MLFIYAFEKIYMPRFNKLLLDISDIDSDALAKIISSKYSLEFRTLEISKNKEINGQSGMVYTFDYIVTSNSILIAVKIANESIQPNDIMIFNSQAMDTGITRKLLLTPIELSDYIKKMCAVYNIDIVDAHQEEQKTYERAKFGITTLDAKLSGGLRPGYVYMLSGITGAGKTTLGSMFLSYGASIGEKGLMILTDTFPDQFLDNIRTMNIGFADYYNNKMIEVMEISDSIRSMKTDISSGKEDFRKFITKVVTELKKIIISKQIKRVVIDPITLLLMPDDDYVNLMLNSLALRGVTVIITSGIRNSDMSMFGVEEYYVTGIIKLNYAAGQDGISRSMNIVKMRGTVFDSNPFNFRITANGIEPIENIRNVQKSNSQANASDNNIFKNIR
jgi:circadian clock protein KaiC